MADMALYRKYRPYKFSDLVGQEVIRVTLQNAVKLDAIAHAYLFCGTRGTGKTSTARLVARAINCENVDENGEPCGQCGICKDIDEGRLIDLIEIDAASNRGIDEIRDLKEKLAFSPTRAKAKVYIIDEVHMLTKEAFNALLKTLEEPPKHSYFILATTEAHKIPETIISRCQRFDFKRIDGEALIQRLRHIATEEKLDIDDEALRMIVKHVNGGLRDAIGLLDQLSGNEKISVEKVAEITGASGDGTFSELYDFVTAKDGAGALRFVEMLFSNGHDFTVFVKNFVWFLREKMIEAVYGDKTAEAYRVLEIIEVIHRVQEKFATSPIPRLPLEAAIVKLCGNAGAISAEGGLAVKETVVSEDKVHAPAAILKETEPPRNVKVVPEEEVEKPSLVGGSPNEAINISLDDVNQKWAEILKSITVPSLRMSLQQAKVAELSAHELLLEFTSKFHYDRVTHASDIHFVELAFQDIVHQSLKVVTRLTDPAQGTADNSDQLLEKAEELFG